MSGAVDVILVDVDTGSEDPWLGDIVGITAIPVIDGIVRKDCSFSTLCKPPNPIHAEATLRHGITDDMVAGKPSIATVMTQFARYCQTHPIGTYDISNTMQLVRWSAIRAGLAQWPQEMLCVLTQVKKSFPSESSYELEHLVKRLDLEVGSLCGASARAEATAEIYVSLRKAEMMEF